MEIKEIANLAYETAKKRKLIHENTNIHACMASISEEFIEALIALENNHLRKITLAEYAEYKRQLDRYEKNEYEKTLKNCFETELADMLITILSTSYHFKIDLERYIDLKLLYNDIRD